MIIKKNEPLKSYTTLKIGGIAEHFYIPENVDDLSGLVKQLGQENLLILSGGSNLLINDKMHFEHIAYMKEVNDEITHAGGGAFYCGCSVRIQKFLDYINNHGYGGCEYLYSLPAMMGGIIYMNAGRGKVYGKSISDFIEAVQVMRSGEVLYLPKQECDFGYRSSIFQQNDDIILGATYRFPVQPIEISKKAIAERLALVKKRQDNSGGNFGSVFSQSDGRIMKAMQIILSVFRSGGVQYSDRTPNWIVNRGNGTFGQAIRLIKFGKLLHRITFQKAKTEVVIWS